MPPNTTNPPFGSFGAICRMIKIEHSIFALPFAYSGAFLAADGFPGLWDLCVLTVAMVAVRSFAMAFNRLADVAYDKKNPRTAMRPLVTGEISIAQTRLFCVFMGTLFVVACAGLNMLCFWLSLPALAWVAAYSYTKRFTWLCHFWLGTCLGLAPLAGWLSVLPTWHMTPILFFWAVTFWVAGFDIFYACMDVDFDRYTGLHSVPAHFGLEKALVIAACCHVFTALCLLLAGLSASLSGLWYVVWLLMAGLLFWEHRCVSADDLSRVNMAFFTLNGIVSVLVFVGVLLGLAA